MSAPFSSSIRKSVEPHLHGAEQLLGAVLAQNAGANSAMMTSALRGPLAPPTHKRAPTADTPTLSTPPVRPISRSTAGW